MQKIIKESFNILKNNLIFIQPLLLYLLFVMTAFTFLLSKNVYFIPKIILLISIILLTAAFTAGWLYINKYGVLSYNPKDSKEETAVKAIQNFKKFFEGVGSEFLKTIGIYMVLCVLYVFIMYITVKLCTIMFGEPKIIYELPKLMNVSSQAEMINFLNSFSLEDKAAFSNWILFSYIISAIMNYFSILYFAVANFEKVNILYSLFKAVKFFLTNILGSVIVMITMFVFYAGLNLMSIVMGTNSLSFVILVILATIYLNYYILLVFYFYYETTKANSNNGPVSIGENETGN